MSNMILGALNLKSKSKRRDTTNRTRRAQKNDSHSSDESNQSDSESNVSSNIDPNSDSDQSDVNVVTSSPKLSNSPSRRNRLLRVQQNFNKEGTHEKIHLSQLIGGNSSGSSSNTSEDDYDPKKILQQSGMRSNGPGIINTNANNPESHLSETITKLENQLMSNSGRGSSTQNQNQRTGSVNNPGVPGAADGPGSSASSVSSGCGSLVVGNDFGQLNSDAYNNYVQTRNITHQQNQNRQSQMPKARAKPRGIVTVNRRGEIQRSSLDKFDYNNPDLKILEKPVTTKNSTGTSDYSTESENEKQNIQRSGQYNYNTSNGQTSNNANRRRKCVCNPLLVIPLAILTIVLSILVFQNLVNKQSSSSASGTNSGSGAGPHHGQHLKPKVPIAPAQADYHDRQQHHYHHQNHKTGSGNTNILDVDSLDTNHPNLKPAQKMGSSSLKGKTIGDFVNDKSSSDSEPTHLDKMLMHEQHKFEQKHGKTNSNAGPKFKSSESSMKPKSGKETRQVTERDV